MFDTPKDTPSPSQPAAGPVFDDGADASRNIRPPTGEVPFGLDEVFFSRTDDRGIIRSGNHVFRRTADYDWTELLGAPHKMVRHRDMPKGLFWLLWDRIKRGEAIGAYVKNRARDGLHYWVFACVLPCEGGYLSAQIKPSSLLFDEVCAEYDALRAAEAEEGLSPEDSAKRLVARLRDHGFDSYARFASHALTEELQSRNEGLRLPKDTRLLRFKSMLDAAERLKAATDELVQSFAAVQIIPHNMRVMASRLEPTGGPFSTLSGNYGSMSSDISKWFETHVVGEDSNFSTINASVDMSMFLEGVVGILRQCDRQLVAERSELGMIDVDAERANLSAIVGTYARRAETGLEVIQGEAVRIQMACSAMHRHILGLGTTRVLCKIEMARMGAAGLGLAEIIGQLGRFQDKIGGLLDEVATLSRDIQGMIELQRRD